MPRLRPTAEWAKSYLIRAIRYVIPMRWWRVGECLPSMVLLLRNPHIFTEGEFRRAAERAWAVSFSSLEGSTRQTIRTDDAVFLEAGPHRLSLVNYAKPYEHNPQEDLGWLPGVSQQRAWAEHTACCWVYYMTAGTDLELAHCVLAKVVAELLDDNCTGVFIPSEYSLIPAEAASLELRRMGSHRLTALIPES
jgi:hypothetical protein